MNKAIFITARVGSYRLPQKHLLELQGMKCIQYVFERAKRSKFTDIIVLCTTNLEEDRILCELAELHGIKWFRGSVKDKLDRWKQAAEFYNVDVIATFDADDLLCEPKLIDLGFGQLERTNCDYIQWNEQELICGSFTYVIKVEALKKVCEEKKSNNTEMAFDFFEKSDWCKKQFLDTSYIGECYNRPEIRLTLDYQSDFNLFYQLFQQFGRNIVNMDLRDIVKFIDKNPKLIQINQHCHQLWKKNQERILLSER